MATTRFPRKVLLLFALLFVGIVWFSTGTRKGPRSHEWYAEEGGGSDWEVHVHLQGAYESFAYDHVVVRDTLARHFELAAAMNPRGEHGWNIHGCCLEENAALGLGPKAALYDMDFVFRFGSEDGRNDFLQKALGSGLGALRLASQSPIGAKGEVTLSLPIPGGAGARLEMPGLRFELRKSMRGLDPFAA